MKYEMWNMESEIWNMNYERWNMKFEFCILTSETWNMKYETWNMNYEISSLNIESEIWNLTSEIRIPKSEIWHLKSGIWNLKGDKQEYQTRKRRPGIWNQEYKTRGFNPSGKHILVRSHWGNWKLRTGHFMFSEIYWSRIQDLQQFIKWIFEIFRRASFPNFSISKIQEFPK